jgi:hypothetical protein
VIGKFLAAVIIVALVGLGTVVSVVLILTGIGGWTLLIPPALGAVLGGVLGWGIVLCHDH